MFRLLFLGSLERLINRYLTIGTNVEVLLQPLHGKVVKIRLQMPNMTFVLCFSEQGVQLLENAQQSADVELHGSALALGLMSLSNHPAQSLFTGKVSMHGDSQVGQQFQTLFESLQINWQQQLASLIGNTAAQRVSELFATSQDWFSETGAAIQEDVSEYLQEESKILPAAAEAQMLFADVDRLRADYDRLAARILRLQGYTGSQQKDNAA